MRWLIVKAVTIETVGCYIKINRSLELNIYPETLTDTRCVLELAVQNRRKRMVFLVNSVSMNKCSPGRINGVGFLSNINDNTAFPCR